MVNSTCPAPMAATSEGAFQGDDPLKFALPLVILQICLVVSLSRGLAFLLHPLRQPRVVAEIIGGILLGPSVLGRSTTFLHTVFPKQSLTVLDTLANIGLLFFMFLVGLELDFKSIRRTGRNALAIAFAGISIPFVLGVGTSFVLRSTIVKGAREGPFLVFMGVALSITAFPVLARILAELKLLTTDIGRIAMSAAAVNDVVAWVLLALAIALSGNGSPVITLWVLLTSVGFLIAVYLLVRPVLSWMARRSPAGEPVREDYVCYTLLIVLAAGFVTDTIGIHPLFGAFTVGVMMPKESQFADALSEKVEDLTTGLFLPLYFTSSGLKTNVATIRGATSWGLLVLVIANACIGKIFGTVAVSLLCRIPTREAFTLGFLMNTKGLVELVVLNIGRDRKVLNDETFAIMVLMALFTTFITTPIVMLIYKPARRVAPYKHRTVEDAGSVDGEFRVLACFHSIRGIPTLTNLIESSRGTRRSRIKVFIMHLVELSERPSAISLVQRARRRGLPFWNRKGDSDEVDVAFQAFRQLSSVSVSTTTAISDLETIHEDIVDGAHQKRTALIILPFHKVLQHDGSLQSLGHAYHAINQRVLRRAPCTVAVLVDRGLGGPSQVSSHDVQFKVAVLFFGGQDDREALAYVSRMAEHPGISVTLARFPPDAVDLPLDTAADDAAVAAFRQKTASAVDEGSTVVYAEQTAGGKDQVLNAIAALGKFNLFIVGRSQPAPALLERTDCPELGSVGSYLASPEFTSQASVVVIKQYDPTADPTPSGELIAATPADATAVVPLSSPPTPVI